MQTLAQRISLAVTHSSLTQRELAKRLNRAESNISRWINGHTVPSAADLAELADVLGISGHWLLTGRGPMRPQEDDLDALVQIYEIARRALEATTPLDADDLLDDLPEEAGDDPA